MTSELPNPSTTTQTDARQAKRRTKRTRRASSARRAAQAADGAHLRLKTGERVDVVRTASEEAWSVFLQEFTRWCVSAEVCELVKHLPTRP